MDVTAERPRTAGRIAPSGRVTPTVHKSNNARRKAIPVPPPRVPTPMPSANNNHQRNDANVESLPAMQTQKIEPQGNIAKIAKRYLDDNMQQAWINPRLISMINMEAVTSTDYDSSNLTRSFNQMGFSTYNYLQFEEKYKTKQYLEQTRIPIKPGFTGRTLSNYSTERNDKIEQNNIQSHSQPEKPHNLSYEQRSRSQDCREFYYQADGKHENRHNKCHRIANEKSHDNSGNGQERKESKAGAVDKIEKRDKSSVSIHAKHNHVRQEVKINGGANQLAKLEQVECHLSGHHKPDDPPKYRPIDRPPKYQEDPPKTEPPPKYCDITRRQDDAKKLQEEKVRRQVGARGGSGLGAEAPTNLTSITPTAREPRGSVVQRQRWNNKQNDTETDEITKVTIQQSRNSFNGGNTYVSGGVILGVNNTVLCPEVMIGCPDTKFKGVESYLRSDKQKNDKIKCDTGKLAEKIKSVQDAMYKPHDGSKGKSTHEPGISHVGYKVDNVKYYGELKGFKSYGAIDKPHQYASSDKGHSSTTHDKSHPRSLQGYPSKISEKSVYSDKYSDNYYHRSVYLKSPNLYPPNVFQETKYAYSVSGVPGTPAQASAAAAFFAR